MLDIDLGQPTEEAVCNTATVAGSRIQRIPASGTNRLFGYNPVRVV